MFKRDLVAIDVETTHLSPDDGRIIEVGFQKGELFFDGRAHRLKVRWDESFSSLVNPEIPLPPAAAALTGLRQTDLLKAPLWPEVRERGADFISPGTLIVGHNLNFDLLFLSRQGMGIEKNPQLDTLELSQTLLPTEASHSLEYLAERLGVKIAVSHRALEDARTAFLVLAECFNQFLLLPPRLRQEIKAMLKGSQLSFRELILDLPEAAVSGSRLFPETPALSPEAVEFSFTDKTIYTLPMSFAKKAEWFVDLLSQPYPLLIGAAHQLDLAAVPERQRLLPPKHALCEIRFQKLLKPNSGLSSAATRLLIKILILRVDFPDSFDLSRPRLAQDEWVLLPLLTCEPGLCPAHNCQYIQSLKLKENRTYAAQNETLFTLAHLWNQRWPEQNLLLFELSEIESGLVSSQSRRLSLALLRGMLQPVFPLDPALPSFGQGLPEPVTNLANELDLFFGILHLAYRKQEGEFAESRVVDEAERSSSAFQQLVAAAGKLASRIKGFVLLEEIDDETQNLKLKLEAASQFLQEFFVEPDPEENFYWLKFDADNLDLYITPRDLAAAWQEFTQRGKGLAVVDTQLPRPAQTYFQKRLGLTDFREEALVVPAPRQSLAVEVRERELTADELKSHLHQSQSSVIVILPNENQLEKFFEFLQNQPEQDYELVSSRHSGSLANLRPKLMASKKSFGRRFVLLTSTYTALRSFRAFPPAQELFIMRLPFEHPSARIGQGPDGFREAVLPRALHLLHILLTRFAAAATTETGKAGAAPRVYLNDPRVLTDYEQEFFQYLSDYPEIGVLVEKN